HQERWLKHGTPQGDDAPGKLASLGAMLLPRPKAPGLAVEESFELLPKQTGLPVSITGTKDFVVRPGELDAKGFLLGDHKTMGQRRYFHEKTKAWLEGNIQSNVYAYAEWVQLHAQGFTELRVVDKQWIYYFRDDKAVEKLRSVQGLDDVRERFERDVVPRVRAMAAMVAAAPKVSDVPEAPGRESCDSYGGCPHRARCFGFGAGSAFAGAGATRFSKSGIIARIEGAVVAPEGLAQQEAEDMGLLAGKFGKATIAEKAKTLPPPKGATGINPPAPKPYTPPVQEETQAEEEMALETAQAIVEEQPKKAAKPKGAEKRVAEVAAQTEKAFAPKQVGDLRAPGGNPAHDYWLFIGCAPTKGFSVEATDLASLLGTAQANAANAAGSSHYRQGNSYGLLESAFAAWMEENAIVGAVFVADPKTIAARDVIDLLRAHANVVVGAVL
ncbi:MAG: hypothetical protein IT381_13890, partial [Deltaproteobacteria bacterium]|nr:hypothetical protein [Deltaproteobacteria bacterium]